MAITPTRIDTEQTKVLTREQMRQELLALPGGVSRMVWKVGSDPSDPQKVFDMVVRPEIVESGYAFWAQFPQAIAGGMNEQLYYHPELGLVWNGSTISLEQGHEELLVTALQNTDGIDLHPEAAPGWQILLAHAAELSPKIRLLKTHIATPTCSEAVLGDDLKPLQLDMYRALMLGHIKKGRMISPRIVVSADDPNPFDKNKLISNFEIMFGDRFEYGRLIEAGTDVLRAVHCCGDGDFLGAMATGAVDVVHWDALKYPDVLRGQPDALEKYLSNGGMLAWGGVPQKMDIMLDLAGELGFDQHGLDVRSPQSYIPVAEFLQRNFYKAVERVYSRYLSWLLKTANESKMDPTLIAKQVFISATCGYGANPVSELRRVSYDLARAAGDLNYKLAL